MVGDDHQSTCTGSDRRVVLVGWLLDVAQEFALRGDTLFRAVYLLDAYLSRQDEPTAWLQLLGCACVWIAAKQQELFAPSAQDMVHLTEDMYAPADLVQMERKVLVVLDQVLGRPTIYTYLSSLLHASSSEEQRSSQPALLGLSPPGSGRGMACSQFMNSGSMLYTTLRGPQYGTWSSHSAGTLPVLFTRESAPSSDTAAREPHFQSCLSHDWQQVDSLESDQKEEAALSGHLLSGPLSSPMMPEDKIDKTHMRLVYLTRLVAEASLLDAAPRQYSPLQVAAACVMIARSMLGKAPWPAALASHASIRSPTDVAPCVVAVAEAYARARQDDSLSSLRARYTGRRMDVFSLMPSAEAEHFVASCRAAAANHPTPLPLPTHHTPSQPRFTQPSSGQQSLWASPAPSSEGIVTHAAQCFHGFVRSMTTPLSLPTHWSPLNDHLADLTQQQHTPIYRPAYSTHANDLQAPHARHPNSAPGDHSSPVPMCDPEPRGMGANGHGLLGYVASAAHCLVRPASWAPTQPLLAEEECAGAMSGIAMAMDAEPGVRDAWGARHSAPLAPMALAAGASELVQRLRACSLQAPPECTSWGQGDRPASSLHCHAPLPPLAESRPATAPPDAQYPYAQPPAPPAAADMDGCQVLISSWDKGPWQAHAFAGFLDCDSTTMATVPFFAHTHAPSAHPTSFTPQRAAATTARLGLSEPDARAQAHAVHPYTPPHGAATCGQTLHTEVLRSFLAASAGMAGAPHDAAQTTSEGALSRPHRSLTSD